MQIFGIFFVLFCKVAVPEGCEYVPLVKKAIKQAKVLIFVTVNFCI